MKEIYNSPVFGEMSDLTKEEKIIVENVHKDLGVPTGIVFNGTDIINEPYELLKKLLEGTKKLDNEYSNIVKGNKNTLTKEEYDNISEIIKEVEYYINK